MTTKQKEALKAYAKAVRETQERFAKELWEEAVSVELWPARCPVCLVFGLTIDGARIQWDGKGECPACFLNAENRLRLER